MNWKRFFLSLAGAAAGGFATTMAAVPPGTPGQKSIIIGGTIAPVVAMVGGLFQPQPHKED